MRTCCGCGKRFNQRSLIRLQVDHQTQCVLPVWTKKSGRSSWVCIDSTCIQNLIRSPKRFYRSLRLNPSIQGLENAIMSWLYGQISKNRLRLKNDGVWKEAEELISEDDNKFSPKHHSIIIHPHKHRQTTIQLIQAYNDLIHVDKFNNSTRTVETFEVNG